VTDEPATEPRNPKAVISESESGLIARTSNANAAAAGALIIVSGFLAVFLIVSRRRIGRKVIS
jgi:hypothetical protein